MLNAKKMRKACLVTVSIVALLVAMVLGLASCSTPTATGAEYVDGSITKSTYEVGEVLDVTGAKIEVTYSDGSVKTVDVTHEMVGTVPLTRGGTQDVTVTYTEGEVTLYAKLSVSVTDPNVALNSAKDDAIDEIEALVTAEDKNDSVISTLLTAYKATIQAAKDEAAVDAAVDAFTAAVNEYKAGVADSETALSDAKTAGIAAMDAALKYFTDADRQWDTKYPNYYADAVAKYDAYKASVEAAETAAAASAYTNACLAEIESIRTKLEAFAEADEETAVNELKIGLINDIRASEDKVVDSPWYSDDVKLSTAAKVQNTIERIYLALDIGYCNDLAADILDDLSKTKSYIDEIYDAYLLIQDVRYTEECEYKIENVWVLYYECLDNITDELGANAENALIAQLKEYTPIGAEAAINLYNGPVENDEYSKKYEGIVGKSERYLELAKAVSVAVNGVEKTDISDTGVKVEVGTDANGNPIYIESVIDKIEAIGKDVTIDSLGAIQAAYDNYLLWAKHYNIITNVPEEKPAELTEDSALYIGSDGKPVVIYVGVDGNDKATIVENYNDLFAKWSEWVKISEALKAEIAELKTVIDSIGTVLIGTTGENAELRLDGVTPVDSLKLIEDAENKLQKIKDNTDYGYRDHGDKYFIVVVDADNNVTKDYREVLKTARDTYNGLKDQALALNREIGRLVQNLGYVEVADKDTLDKIANLYAEFCADNTETYNGKTASYAGVIEEYYYYLDALNAWHDMDYRTTQKNTVKDQIEALHESYKDQVAAADLDKLKAVCNEYKGKIEDRDYMPLADDVVASQTTLEKNYADNKAALVKIYEDALAAMKALVPQAD